MKRHNQNVPRFLRNFFERFQKMPSADVEPAWERLLERHRDHLEGVFEGFAAAPVRSKPPAFTRRPVWAAAAALLVVAAVISVELLPVRAPASVAAVDGGLHRLVDGKTQDLQAGETIRLGELIRSNGGSGGTLTLADGSRVEMRTQSELLLEHAADGVLIQLRNGGIIVNAAKQRKGHLYVRTKDVTVSVVGTVFLVNSEEEGSRVAVIEGEVRVEQGAIEKKLRPGQQVATNPSMETRPVSQEISWSRNVEAHLALLAQSTAEAAVQKFTEARKAFEVASIRPRNSPGGGGGGGRGGGGAAPPACGGSPATIDPGRFVLTNATLYRLIAMAYGKDCASLEVSDVEFLSGGPEWIRSDKFDIEAVIPKGSPNYTRQQLSLGNAPELQMMLQTLLAERFKLVLRQELKEMPVYLLTVGTGTPKLTPWKAEDGTRYVVNTGLNATGQISTVIGGKKVSLADLAQQLMLVTRRVVLDTTAITGEFNYSFEFAPSDDQPGVREMRANARFPFLSGPSIFTALEEHLGLKLEASRAPVEVLIIDHAERPTEN
jgi:uncharacterized protein (TIGR03435 family)